MKNDLWYLGKGFWTAYTEDGRIMAEFKNIKEMQLTATYYHYRKGGIRAAQFNFHQGEQLVRGRCLLSYVCSRMHLDFSAALELCRNNDSTPYAQKYPRRACQLELLLEETPPRTGKRVKKTK